MTRQELTSEALKLSPIEREAFAEELLLSIDDVAREDIDSAWLVEARRRDQAYEAGKMAAKPVADVISRLENKISQ